MSTSAAGGMTPPAFGGGVRSQYETKFCEGVVDRAPSYQE